MCASQPSIVSPSLPFSLSRPYILGNKKKRKEADFILQCCCLYLLYNSMYPAYHQEGHLIVVTAPESRLMCSRCKKNSIPRPHSFNGALKTPSNKANPAKQLNLRQTYTHTRTHTHIYIGRESEREYVCVRVCVIENENIYIYIYI